MARQGAVDSAQAGLDPGHGGRPLRAGGGTGTLACARCMGCISLEHTQGCPCHFQELPKASALLFDQPLILIMGTDPDPNEVCAVLHGHGAVTNPDPCGP